MQSKINAFFKSSSSSSSKTQCPSSPPLNKSFINNPEICNKESEILITYSRRVQNPNCNDKGSKKDDSLVEKSGKVLNKKRSYAQLHLDVGQSDFLLHTCNICGFKYAAGDEEDDKVHKTFHRNYTHGILFKGWRHERVIQMPSLEGKRIILVLEGDPPPQRNKVQEVVKMMEMELGEGWIFHKHCKVYLFVSSQRVAGCLLAEPIKKAYKMVSNSVDTKFDHSNENKVIYKSPALQFGGVTFCREVVRRTAPDNARQLSDEYLNGPILCEEESVPALCGVRAIWVTPSNRRKHIATHLLDAVRKSFCEGSILERWQLAFSQPTLSGKALLCNYIGRSSFLVYTTTEYN